MKTIEKIEGKKGMDESTRRRAARPTGVLQNDLAGLLFQECTDLPTGRSCQDGKGVAESQKIPMEVGCICTEKYRCVPNNGLENRKKKREVACSRSTTTIG